MKILETKTTEGQNRLTDVEHFVDMQITAQDVRAGVPCSTSLCPVAEAVQRHVAAPCFVRASYGRIEILKRTKDGAIRVAEATTPISLGTWMFRFDEHMDVRPIKADLKFSAVVGFEDVKWWNGETQSGDHN